MFKRMGQMLMIVAVLAATDTQWLILQSVAWTTMLARNLHNTSLDNAMAETFDGKHPCSMCKAIADGKKSEKKSDFTVSFKQLEFLAPITGFAFQRPQTFTLAPAPGSDTARSGRPQKPPVPPPRGVSA
jgi:hypothetical protein